jgi:hypothetical protein
MSSQRWGLLGLVARLADPTAARADIAPSPSPPLGSVSFLSGWSLPLLLGAVAAAILTVALSQSRRERVSGRAPRSRSALFALAGLCIVLSVLAALPHFLTYRLKPRWPEAASNLGAIRSTEVAYFAEWNCYIGGQPPTPVADRRRNRDNVPWLADTRFSMLGFAPEGSVRCSYSLEGPLWPTAAQGFTARAECDLDNDGKLAVYTVTQASRTPYTGEISVSGDKDDSYR